MIYLFYFLRHVSTDRHVRLGHHVVVLGYDQDGGAWWRNSRSTGINDDASDIFFFLRHVSIDRHLRLGHWDASTPGKKKEFCLDFIRLWFYLCWCKLR